MDNNKSANQLISTMEGWFKQLPPLPANAVNAIAKITPILALVFGILGVLLSIAGLGILSFLTPFAMMGGAGTHYGTGIIATLGWLASSILMIMAYPGLKSGKMSGWNILFYSEAINVVTSLIGINIGSVIGAIIGFYLLFQIKPKYK